MRELVKYVCPKCGQKTKQLDVATAVYHVCQKNNNRETNFIKQE